MDLITLASLQLLVDFGENNEKAFSKLQSEIARYVPFNKLNQGASTWTDRIIEFYRGLKSSSKLEAKLTYLEHLKNSALYQSHQFYMKVRLF